MAGDDKAWGERTPAFAHLIKWAEMAVRSRVEKAMRPLTISSGQLLLLAVLEEMGEATPASLARALHLTPQAMTTLLKPLDARGLIARRPDETNRRRVLLRLTDKADAVLAEVRKATPEIEDDMLAALSRSERETLRSLLMRIARPFG
ncbi:MAG TPA: MarR family transcriptional regulator [Allosphingosinicella sp.]|nr:MarR family transcriptional regulator [Allosphingosinicella sp.]